MLAPPDPLFFPIAVCDEAPRIRTNKGVFGEGAGYPRYAAANLCLRASHPRRSQGPDGLTGRAPTMTGRRRQAQVPESRLGSQVIFKNYAGRWFCALWQPEQLSLLSENGTLRKRHANQACARCVKLPCTPTSVLARSEQPLRAQEVNL